MIYYPEKELHRSLQVVMRRAEECSWITSRLLLAKPFMTGQNRRTTDPQLGALWEM